MRTIRFTAVVLLSCASLAGAQQPDSAARSRQRADSIAKAVRDSIALMKELGAGLAAPSGAAAPGSGNVGPQSGPANPRLLPDISAVGDLVGDLSPRGSTQADRSRFGVREVELAVQSVVDPYFRGDVFLGISDVEKISIEQAFLTTTSLPNELELRIGRFLMPFGKQNLTHRHDLHTIEYPYVIQRLLSDDGLKGTGLWGSRVFAPFGFYQEVQVTAIDRLSRPVDSLHTAEDVNRSLGGLGFSARLRNYVDLSESQNVELSFSALTGKRERALGQSYLVSVEQPTGQFVPTDVNAIVARQTTYGADLTYRWRPLQQGLYQSFILQSEVMRQVNERVDDLVAPCANCATVSIAERARDYTGAYVFARYQTTQRTFLGARYDWLQNPENDGRTLNAGSVYLEWYPSEFSKLMAGYEGLSNSGDRLVNRLLVQAVFSLGPHKPHPF
ncbi:MAG: hypothetical protein JWN79_1790 [Gemmatimonadetes bacterium]|jgi:hypothetical protein|nr:hypothetical protein [Gemmatimonadota bacterium]